MKEDKPLKHVSYHMQPVRCPDCDTLIVTLDSPGSWAGNSYPVTSIQSFGCPNCKLTVLKPLCDYCRILRPVEEE